ncbi:MAG: FAD-dependent oxidoreductase, partial [Gemmatimonadaceae bacterium]
MIVVIGGGPAGIAAAARAAESGQEVTLVDESPRAGGQIWRHRERTSLPAVARRWLARLDRSGAVVRAGTSVIGVQREDDAFVVTAEHDGKHAALRATQVILATGARERFLPFPGWTLPGVIGVG